MNNAGTQAEPNHPEGRETVPRGFTLKIKLNRGPKSIGQVVEEGAGDVSSWQGGEKRLIPTSGPHKLVSNNVKRKVQSE